MESIVYLFATFGLAYLIKESNGPWDSMTRFRQYLLSNPNAGVFFYKLLSCYFCVGFHAGWMVYLLYRLGLFFILWGLAGSAISLILDAVLIKLYAVSVIAPKQSKTSKQKILK